MLALPALTVHNSSHLLWQGQTILFLNIRKVQTASLSNRWINDVSVKTFTALSNLRSLHSVSPCFASLLLTLLLFPSIFSLSLYIFICIFWNVGTSAGVAVAQEVYQVIYWIEGWFSLIQSACQRVLEQHISVADASIEGCVRDKKKVCTEWMNVWLVVKSTETIHSSMFASISVNQSFQWINQMNCVQPRHWLMAQFFFYLETDVLHNLLIMGWIWLQQASQIWISTVGNHQHCLLGQLSIKNCLETHKC